ncbi:MAG: TIGR04211 family SH3 domain-containing protein [Desulfohalobiaceae bacterium]|nr:TIGR04211 family SH3 domain-containing protein [Desulfohalobiaceae bacterium]
MRFATMSVFSLLFLLVILNTPLQAKTAYVTDTIKITMRNGPSTQNKILKMLPSGTKLEVIDQASGWVKVATSDGKTGWVIEQYTMEQPPKDVVIKDLKQDIQELKKDNQEYQTTISELKEENSRFKKLATESGSNVSALNQKVALLQQELEQARKNDKRKWFLYGVGVVAGSALFGFIFGRLRRKQPSKLHF